MINLIHSRLHLIQASTVYILLLHHSSCNGVDYISSRVIGQYLIQTRLLIHSRLHLIKAKQHLIPQLWNVSSTGTAHPRKATSHPQICYISERPGYISSTTLPFSSRTMFHLSSTVGYMWSEPYRYTWHLELVMAGVPYIRIYFFKTFTAKKAKRFWAWL